MKGRSKKINQYSLDGEYIQTFPSKTKALESLGLAPGTTHTLTLAIETGTDYYRYFWDYACEEDN